MNNVCKSVFFRLANSSFEKVVFLLLAQYAIACDAITVANYCFMWYSVVINVM
jgi:hypothetical protein